MISPAAAPTHPPQPFVAQAQCGVRGCQPGPGPRAAGQRDTCLSDPGGAAWVLSGPYLTDLSAFIFYLSVSSRFQGVFSRTCCRLPPSLAPGWRPAWAPHTLAAVSVLRWRFPLASRSVVFSSVLLRFTFSLVFYWVDHSAYFQVSLHFCCFGGSC